MADERITKPARDVRMDSKREYSEIEIEVAKNLLKEGYGWIARDEGNTLYAYKDRPAKRAGIWASVEHWLLLMSGDAIGVIPLFKSIRWKDDEPVRIRDIVPQILTDEEREWLRTVVKPFRDRLKAVEVHNGAFYGRYVTFTVACPAEWGDSSNVTKMRLLVSEVWFEGMENSKNYTPEELGL